MSDSDPDNYSIDEMMHRLKSKDGETKEGERRLVVRPDGTKVVKVKRRKRRTKQPHKEAEAKRRRRTLITVSVVALIFVLLGLGGIGWVVYLNSATYRDKVVADISEWSGADVEVVAFRATPVGAGADTLIFTWPDDCPVASLKVNFTSANLMLSSHLTGVWTGQQINAGSGELVIRDSPAGEPLNIPSGVVPFQMPMRINQMNIKFGEGGRVPFAVYRTAGSLGISNPEAPEPNIVIQGGDCRLGRWGKFNVNYASVRLGRTGTSLGTLQLSPENEASAELILTGEGLPPLPVRGGESELRLEMREVPSFSLFGAGLGALIEGTFESPPEDSTGRAYLDLSDVDSIRIDCPLQSMRGSVLKLYRFQLFSVLSQALSSPRFTQPRFDSESSLRVTRTDSEVRLSEIRLEASGMLKVQGEMTEAIGGRLSGNLEVGLAQALVETSATRTLSQVFTRLDGGYLWASVELSGSVKAPIDNLREQLEEARKVNATGGGAASRFESEFEELTRPQD